MAADFNGTQSVIDITITDLCKQVEELKKERDYWKNQYQEENRAFYEYRLEHTKRK